eukprot:6188845-Pleurochrysis_carterae.AAC.5
MPQLPRVQRTIDSPPLDGRTQPRLPSTRSFHRAFVCACACVRARACARARARAPAQCLHEQTAVSVPTAIFLYAPRPRRRED